MILYNMIFPEIEDKVYHLLARSVCECSICTFLVLLSYITGVSLLLAVALPILVYLRVIILLEKKVNLISNKSTPKAHEVENLFYVPYVVNSLSLVFIPFMIPYFSSLYLPTLSPVTLFSSMVLTSNLYILPIFSEHPVFRSIHKFYGFAHTQAQLLLILHLNAFVAFYVGAFVGFLSLISSRVKKVLLPWVKYFSKQIVPKGRNFFLVIIFGIFYPMFAGLTFFFPLRIPIDLTVITAIYLLGSCAVYIIIFFIILANKSQEA